MDEITKKFKNMIEKQIKYNQVLNIGEAFSKYQKTYFSTNENINEYINGENFNNALCVLASGDHLLNLITNNTLNVDTFDTNSFTEYFVFGLKYAMIEKYSYIEYLSCLSKFLDKSTSLEEIYLIIDDLLPNMDIKYRKFWKIINEFNYKMQKAYKTNLNLLHLLTINIKNMYNIVFINNYLYNYKEYNKLKENIKKANVNFKNIDVMDLYDNYDKKYDAILLSNIFDYLYQVFGYDFKYKDAKEFIENLKSMLNKDGKLYLNYIFRYASKTYERANLIRGSKVKLSDIENGSVMNVTSLIDRKLNDGVLVLKK